MLELSDVLPLFSEMADITEDEALRYKESIQKNREEVLSRVIPGKDVKENKAKLVLAVAGLSFYDYVLQMAVKEPQSSFTAGEISVSRDIDRLLQSAKQYRDHCLMAARDCLRYDGFVFEGVGER